MLFCVSVGSLGVCAQPVRPSPIPLEPGRDTVRYPIQLDQWPGQYNISLEQFPTLVLASLWLAVRFEK